MNQKQEPAEGKPSRSGGWRKDFFASSEVLQVYAWIPLVVAAAAAGLLLSAIFWFRSHSAPAVVVYTSQDKVYSEAIFDGFSKATGTVVRAVYDSEAVKTVGLANRLLAEKDHPRCDVFWSNEELRTRQLAAAGVFESWAPMAGVYRERQYVVNTNLVRPGQLPGSLMELTNAAWSGKIALAYPLFGTTATHFLALRQHWGETRWLDWCRALAANRPLVVDGNSVVVKLVAAGEAVIGLTDSDDIRAGQREGLPIGPASLGGESLGILNTIGLVRGSPRARLAASLADYLNTDAAKARLVAAGAVEPATESSRPPAAGIEVDWPALLRDLDPATDQLKQVFLR